MRRRRLRSREADVTASTTHKQRKRATVDAQGDALVLPGEGTLWIRCRAYRVHREHHRRDPATGAWRCFLCQPEGVDR